LGVLPGRAKKFQVELCNTVCLAKNKGNKKWEELKRKKEKEFKEFNEEHGK